MRRRVMLALVIGAVCLPAGVARADDNSVYGAYVSRDADFVKLGKQFRSGLRTWQRSHETRPARALRALTATTTAIDELKGTIEAEQPSSDHGTRAKAAALDSLKLLRGSAVAYGSSITALTHRHKKRGLRLARRSDRLAKLSTQAEKRARREFKAAGVDILRDG